MQVAQERWWNCCSLSGTWDEHPELLEEISKALNSYMLFSNKHFEEFDFITFLAWFEVNTFFVFANLLTGSSQVPKIQPTSRKYHPLEVQYRLFQTWWKTMLNCYKQTQCPLHVFTIYEVIDLEFVTGHTLSTSGFRPFPFIMSSPERVCLVFHENYATPLAPDDPRHKYRKAFEHLFKRLLPGPECLKEYRADIVYSDAEVTIRFLDKLCYVPFLQSRSK